MNNGLLKNSAVLLSGRARRPFRAAVLLILGRWVLNACLAKARRRRVGRWVFTAALLAAGAQLQAQSTGIFVNSSNNVGIGTTTPSNTLTVSGGMLVDSGGKLTNVVVKGEKVTPPNLVYLANNYVTKFYTREDANYGLAIFDQSNAVGLQAADLVNGNSAQSIVLNPFGGNVGIGTTNPQVTLDINGGEARIINGNGNAAQFDLIQTTGGHDWALVSWGSAAGGGTLSNKFSIFDNTSGGHRLTIDSSGNVGIGTATPAAKLDVAGQTRAEGGISLPNNSWISGDDTAGNSHLVLGIYANNVIGVGDITNRFGGTELFAANQGFEWYVNNNQIATITSSGNLGIGTSSPAYKLDVAGQVHATSFVSSTTTYADFVFKPGYKLAPLSDVEASIKKDGHLPGIPSETEAKAHGIDLTQMQVKLLQKIEELTLHQIEQQKLLEDQNKRLDQQSQRIGQLEQENTELRAQN